MLLHLLPRPSPRWPCRGSAATLTVRCASSAASPSSSAAASGQQVVNVHSYVTVDFERRPAMRWSSLYRRVVVGNSGRPVRRILADWDEGERLLDKWELCRIARELRRFRQSNLALQKDLYKFEDKKQLIEEDLKVLVKEKESMNISRRIVE